MFNRKLSWLSHMPFEGTGQSLLSFYTYSIPHNPSSDRTEESAPQRTVMSPPLTPFFSFTLSTGSLLRFSITLCQ